MTVGVTEGSIIANIMTAHITNMKTKSDPDHAIPTGVIILSGMVACCRPMRSV